jgi:hypothetical protein
VFLKNGQEIGQSGEVSLTSCFLEFSFTNQMNCLT